MRRWFWVAAVALGFVFMGGAPVYATEASACGNYLYKGTNTSLCDRFQGWKDVDCPEVKHAVTVTGSDKQWKLDADGDKTGCDDATGYTPPKPSPSSASPSPSKTSTSPSPSASATTIPTTPTTRPSSDAPSKSPLPSKSPVAGGVAEPELPVTGPSGWVLSALGIAITVIGGAAFLVSRRRINFES